MSAPGAFLQLAQIALNAEISTIEVSLHVHLGQVVPFGVFMRWFAFLHK